ncbi:phage tail protein [Stenotrophomonas sp. B1-1]|uniref:phage tail protein n=1 Tax=Stenotrophomonas sp. B1-1 TaxID=2710648 RepID=UPI0013D90EBB|nr:phage tail protein [Stenotrophomonas sp. B1-1]
MSALPLTFTAAGRAALINAPNTGTRAVTVTAIGLTEQAFIPDPAGGDTVLPGEFKRLETFGGKAVADDVIHISLRDEGSDTYALRGIGLYLDDGTLLCVYGQEEVILEKSGQAILMLAADMVLTDVEATSIAFGSTEFLNPPATTTEMGVVELATSAEAITGSDAQRAVTPAALAATLDDRLGKGVPNALTKQLLAAATQAALRALLELKAAALKDEGDGNGLDADLLDGQHGAFYLDWANMTGVPASTHIPGQVFAFAGATAPAGTLPCNGAAVSRQTYAALFAAIGTRYGDGDGASTFNVPNLINGTVPVQQSDQSRIGTATDGEVIGHTHEASTAGAGRHGHGASSGAGGDHIHGAWTDQQGHHGHTGATAAVGDHQHVSPFAEAGVEYPWGGDYNPHPGSKGNLDWDNPWPYTSPSGNHAHSFATDGAGTHGHNIGMNGSGPHTHDVHIAETGEHTHATTVIATGGQRNLPAGVGMLYCIVY